MRAVFTIAACISILCVIFICLFLFTNGLPAVFKIGIGDFIFGTKWAPSNNIFGILPMILGSIYVTAFALAIGAPIGIFSAVYLVYYCPKRLYQLLKPMINLLAGIPSIIYGFFGLVVLVPFVREVFGGNGKEMLTAGILLGFMILPTVVAMSESALRAVPSYYFEGALAIGATKERSIFRTVIPAAKSGVLAGVILGLGRAIGETMAVIMVAGNQAIIPESVLQGFRTMTANIVLEMGYAADLHREALIATAVVLFVFILVINSLFSILKRKDAANG